MKVKLTFPLGNAQTSRLWRIADAICQGLVLPSCQFAQTSISTGQSSGGCRFITFLRGGARAPILRHLAKPSNCG